MIYYKNHFKKKFKHKTNIPNMGVKQKNKRKKESKVFFFVFVFEKGKAK
jgi:hypothetical protein